VSRDRLRELLDAVLDEDHRTLADMAGGAHSSPFHFARTLRRDAGEPPVALRRRVMLERAAWQLAGGAGVTEVAFGAGYESVEGFARAYARAYGYPPTATPPGVTAGSAHWLPAPNGIHFHAPFHLWVAGPARDAPGEVTALLVHQDVDDVRALLELAKGLPDAEWAHERLPGLTLLRWAGPEGSLQGLLNRCVGTYEVWLASIAGEDHPGRGGEDAGPAALLDRLDEAGPRWIALVRDIDRRGAWGDRVVDALCDPPQSFVLGSVAAHVLTYSVQRRGLARAFLRQAGVEIDDGDPLLWLRESAR
jgi:AraC-like DNA-binding protein